MRWRAQAACTADTGKPQSGNAGSNGAGRWKGRWGQRRAAGHRRTLSGGGSSRQVERGSDSCWQLSNAPASSTVGPAQGSIAATAAAPICPAPHHAAVLCRGPRHWLCVRVGCQPHQAVLLARGCCCGGSGGGLRWACSAAGTRKQRRCLQQRLCQGHWLVATANKVQAVRQALPELHYAGAPPQAGLHRCCAVGRARSKQHKGQLAAARQRL